MFGIASSPGVDTFFVSWKSDTTIRMNSGPGKSGWESFGIGKTATPVFGSKRTADICSFL